jgi:hypothetical protein
MIVARVLYFLGLFCFGTNFAAFCCSQTYGLQDAFYVLDLGLLIQLFQQWVKALPRVKPFYAVKCSPDPALLSTLAELGTGFDCASKAEIAQVLALGVPTERILFANPCKMQAHVKYAASVGVTTMTFDSEMEVCKTMPNLTLFCNALNLSYLGLVTLSDELRTIHIAHDMTSVVTQGWGVEVVVHQVVVVCVN